MLKLNQLQAFNELMLVGSVSEAARNLHRTQSSISATIASIEENLGMQLFERKGGRLHPVQEAKYLHEECSEILRRLETLSDNMHRMKSLETGKLNIASMPGPAVYFLPNLIAHYSANNPEISSVIAARSSEGVYRQMSAQRYDIGLADYIPEFSAEATLIDTRVFDLRCLCALPEEHPLRDKEVISPADLSGQALATLGEDHAIHSEIATMFAQAGEKANFCYMAQYFLSLFAYVENNLACAIVDPISVESYILSKDGRPRIHFIPLSSPVYFHMALVTPKHRPSSVIATDFQQHLTETIEKCASGSQISEHK